MKLTRFDFVLNHRDNIFVRTLLLSDSVQVRWLMALASAAWARDMIFDGHTVFSRDYYLLMAEFAPPLWWGFAYLLHAVGAAWRIWDGTHREVAALLINGWGLTVWGLAIYFQILHAGRWIPTLGADGAAFVMLLLAFVTSGWNTDSQTA